MKINYTRRILAGTMAAAITMGAVPTASATLITATSTTASGQHVMVDGRIVKPTGYQINGSNYFMLRDIGKLVGFNVTFDNAAKAIQINTNAAYVPAQGESMNVVDNSLAKRYSELSDQPVFVDGAPVQVTAYTIGNSNFIKLRDIGKLVDFGVAYDGASKTVKIDTRVGYTEDSSAGIAGGAAPATPPASQDAVPDVTPPAKTEGAATAQPPATDNSTSYDNIPNTTTATLEAVQKVVNPFDMADKLELSLQRFRDATGNSNATEIDMLAAIKFYENSFPVVNEYPDRKVTSATIAYNFLSTSYRNNELDAKQDVANIWTGEDYSKLADQSLFTKMVAAYPESTEAQARSDYNHLYNMVHNVGVNNVDARMVSDVYYSMITDVGHATAKAFAIPTYLDENHSYETIQERQRGVKYFENEAQRIAGLATDTDKIAAIRKLICDTYKYDGDDSATYRTGWSTVLPGERFAGKGIVCADFCAITGWLLQQTNIPTFVSGNLFHVWNAVYIDGKWWNFDTSSIDEYSADTFIKCSDSQYRQHSEEIFEQFSAEVVIPGSSKDLT